MSRPDPNALFEAKHRSVATILDYNAKRWRVPDSDCDDVRQNALMQLWRSCVRACDPSVPPFTISATIIVLSALRQWHHQRRRDRTVAVRAELLDTNAAKCDDLIIVEDGTQIVLTRNEARAEAGGLLDLWNHGYTTREVARLLGVSKQRVHQMHHQLGGVLFTTDKRGRVRYPRSVVDAEVVRRGGRARGLTDGSHVPDQRA